MNTPTSANNNQNSLSSNSTIIQSIVFPPGYESHLHNDSIRLGNSLTSSSFLYVEQLSQKSAGVPTVMADGELDLFICSIGELNHIQKMGQEIPVAGSIREDSIKGYLLWIDYKDGEQFLILSGTKENASLDKSQSTAREMAHQLSNLLHMKAAA